MGSSWRVALLVAGFIGAGCEQCQPVVEIYRAPRAPGARRKRRRPKPGVVTAGRKAPPAPRARSQARAAPRRLLVPAAVENAVRRRTRRTFSWIREMGRPWIRFCEIRIAYGVSAWALGRKHGVPLWVLERLNRGRDLSRLRGGQSLRVPAASDSLAAECFTPVRGWRDRPDSKPPFYW